MPGPRADDAADLRATLIVNRPSMLTFSLQSGSNGNCIYVEAGDVRLLFDAGISGREAALRLAGRGRDIRDVTALILSHEHGDHSRCAGVFARKFKLPVYVTSPTWRRIGPQVGPVDQVRHFVAGRRLEFGPVVVHSIPTPHDAVDGCAFVVEHEHRRLGILTDLGHPFPALRGVLGELDGAYLESNYDPQMLADGTYPPELKARIRGPHGHLSNPEAAELVRRHRDRRLRWIILSHLSENNNEPALALDTFRSVVGRDFPVFVAGRDGASRVLELRG